MFARVFALLPLALLASATTTSQCNTGSTSCCNSVQSLSQAQSLLNSLGLLAAATQAGGQVGVTCSPTTIIGTSTGCSSTQQPVCCTGNNFNGVVNIGCTPINVNA